jgi:antitoxin FitA
MSATITISLSEEQSARLSELSKRLNVTVEELARAGIEDLLNSSDEDFEQAAQHVMQNNAELYRRLS